ncbi:hypothetical protein TRP8649_01400 [Pelagimonas phthalicica]|uniref:Uncharacterized protein n=1 Tax=Pelagimonas phthalicica TaxID=1037362 RepID=A0A238JAX4_9RHOB|nr:hypothetical protein [Pelagimonas phthalicica]TDS94178.1 hypothetical protein CLV87_0672 [Pelagimonas phthalicica]SMX27297.1 hypothetical protein TRP8649_01400 [Pelagimonas phthalicica]
MSEAQITLEQHAALEAEAKRSQIRQSIARDAGDVASLLGTTSDAVALTFFGLAQMAAQLSTANSLAEVRAATEPFATLSADFLAKVASGEVVLPFEVKGTDAVLAEIEQRATAVSSALQEA